MSEWIYEDNEQTILIGINPSSSKLEFPSNIQKIHTTNEGESLLQKSSISIHEISFKEGSGLIFLSNYSFAYCSTLETANFSNCLLLESLSACLFLESKITNVILPENGKLTNLCNGCFRSTKLTSIKIPDTVKTFEPFHDIYRGIFESCANLFAINISKNSKLNSIGYAIGQMSGLVSFYIPHLVSYISVGAFSEMKSLEHLYVDEKNQNFKSFDDIVYSSDMTLLHTCAANKKTKIEIPESVTSFQYEAFRTCQMTYEFIIPETIKEIPHNCFYSSLFSSIVLPQNLESIGTYSLRNTRFLSIIIPKSVKQINQYAFLYSKLEQLYFQYYQQDISISNYAFYRCYYLFSIHIPSKMVKFESKLVFSDCFSLKEVYYIVSPLTYYTSIFDDSVKFNVHLHGASNQTNKKNIYYCGDVRNIFLSNNACHLHSCPKPFYEQFKFSSYLVFLYILYLN